MTGPFLTRMCLIAGGLMLGVILAACGGGDGSGAGAVHATPPLHVVALGDSDATGIGDPSSKGWVGRYAEDLQATLRTKVVGDNRAVEGMSSEQLARELATDSDLGEAVASADVVLIGLGGADLNSGDDELAEGSCRGRACYTDILRDLGRNLAAILVRVRQLAPHARILAMSMPNAYPGGGSVIPSFITASISKFQVTAERDIICRTVRDAHGQCVDVVRAFNGPGGDEDAYVRGLMTKDPCCYPSGRGQELIARLLIAKGTDGLVRRR